MKKITKLTTATFVALSALTPVAAFASEDTATQGPAAGIYTDTGYFTSLAELTKSEVKSLLKGALRGNKGLVIVTADGTVYDVNKENGLLVLTAENLEELKDIAQTYEQFKEETGKDLGIGGIIINLTVKSVSAINDITVENGVDPELSKTVTGTLAAAEGEEAKTVELSVEWTTPEGFDNKVAGTYEFTGKVTAPEGYVLSDELATVKANVIVKEAVSLKPEVTSVSAINVTTIEVKFSKEVDNVTVENFAVTGGNVTAVQVSEDKKTATLTVDGLDYNTVYPVKVIGLTETEVVKEVKTPGIEDLWDLQIIAEPTSLVADGISTGVIKFELHGPDGKIDKNANNVVLDLNSTYGFLSQKRVTIQNGTAEVIMRSEFMTNKVNAKIDAQIIEASNQYKELIGKIFASTHVELAPKGSDNGGTTILLKSLEVANSNEADRVTLTFDEEVGPEDFYTVNTAGQPVLKNNIIVSQDKDLKNAKSVKGFLFDPSDRKVVTVVLQKDHVLDDNRDVYVQARMGEKAHTTKTQFKLADARIANITSVKEINNKMLDITFSEGIHSAELVIDARFVAGDDEDFTVKYGDLEWENGRFVDYRNKATVELTAKYQEPDKDKNGNHIYPAGYFKSGKHALEASNIYDFAAKSDDNNIGQTQVLEFDIKEDKQEVVLSQSVDSPEQFRVAFDKDVSFQEYKEDADGNFISKETGKKFEDVVEFQVWDAKADQNKGKWLKVDEKYFTEATEDAKSDLTSGDFVKYTGLNKDGQVADGSMTDKKVVAYKLETKHDWTHVYDTKTTKDNYYNDQFRLVLPKGTVVTAANGKFNTKEIVLPLSSIDGKTTALGKPDVTSPVIKTDGITRIKESSKLTNQFLVDLTEPVKWNDGENIDGAGQTLAQGQAALPDTKVEFIGKDKDGKTRTLTGKVVGYADAINDKLIVAWDTAGSDTPQSIVNQEGNTNTEWTLVIKSLSDDVGNTVPTATQTFELERTVIVNPEGEFRVAPTSGSAVGEDGVQSTFAIKGVEGDTIEITYTEAVAITGLGSATNVKNYTLNGKDLPTGTSIALAPTKDGKGKIDNKVVIKLAEGTLNAKNVITLASQISSKDGKLLAYDKAFTFTLYKANVAVASANLTTMTDLKIVEQPALNKTLVAFEAPTDEKFKDAVGLGLELLDVNGNVIDVVSLEKKVVNNKDVYTVVMDTALYEGAASINVITN